MLFVGLRGGDLDNVVNLFQAKRIECLRGCEFGSDGHDGRQHAGVSPFDLFRLPFGACENDVEMSSDVIGHAQCRSVNRIVDSDAAGTRLQNRLVYT